MGKATRRTLRIGLTLLGLGATARVELSGADPHETGRFFEVELSRERVAVLNLDAGQRVRLQPARIRLFAPDAPLVELTA